MSEDKGSINGRLEQSSYGTPKINPDEQRKYLGTFRERVSLAIPIKDLTNPAAFDAFKKDVQSNSDYQLILNGQTDQSKFGNYMKFASDHNVQFTIKTDSFYHNDPDSYGVIYAAKEAIDQSPIDWQQKYGQDNAEPNQEDANDKKPSLWTKIKNIF